MVSADILKRSRRRKSMCRQDSETARDVKTTLEQNVLRTSALCPPVERSFVVVAETSLPRSVTGLPYGRRRVCVHRYGPDAFMHIARTRRSDKWRCLRRFYEVRIRQFGLNGRLPPRHKKRGTDDRRCSSSVITERDLLHTC